MRSHTNKHVLQCNVTRWQVRVKNSFVDCEDYYKYEDDQDAAIAMCLGDDGGQYVAIVPQIGAGSGFAPFKEDPTLADGATNDNYFAANKVNIDVRRSV
jgi:hypothetical protein